MAESLHEALRLRLPRVRGRMLEHRHCYDEKLVTYRFIFGLFVFCFSFLKENEELHSYPKGVTATLTD